MHRYAGGREQPSRGMGRVTLVMVFWCDSGRNCVNGGDFGFIRAVFGLLDGFG